MKIQTKTLKGMVQQVYRLLGNGCVTHHDPTENNKMGQSGVHTFVDDLITIVLESSNEADAYRNLHKYLIHGAVIERGHIKDGNNICAHCHTTVNDTNKDEECSFIPGTVKV